MAAAAVAAALYVVLAQLLGLSAVTAGLVGLVLRGAANVRDLGLPTFGGEDDTSAS